MAAINGLKQLENCLGSCGQVDKLFQPSYTNHATVAALGYLAMLATLVMRLVTLTLNNFCINKP